MPKELARRTLLFALRILDAVRGLRDELKPRRRYFLSAYDAATVLTAVQAAQGLVDEGDAILEQPLPRNVELPSLRLASHIRGVLIGEGDVAAAFELRHGEPLSDPPDRCRKVRALALESLAHRGCVHLALPYARIGLVLPQDVSKRRSDVHLLDVREQDEWDAGHIEGAQHIPLGELAARLAEVPKEQVVVAVCRSGSRSDRAAKGLRMSGFEAENLDGGVTAWARAGLPLVARAGGPGRVI